MLLHFNRASKSVRALSNSNPSRLTPILRNFSESSDEPKKLTLVQRNQNVHSFMQLSKSWRNKPLFRRQGDVRFKTGLEAANLLVDEAKRRDEHEVQFIESVESVIHCLSPIFERNPRYAFVAKQLMEPERFVQFHVPWLDDTGVTRMNRGYRIQYSSSLGHYAGPLHLGPHVNSSLIKSLGFDTVFSNALTGYTIGAAVGGSDICPFDKSEAEMQRFCQSFMTELSMYIGPDIDVPTMGKGVGEKEIGYMFGQYKRINIQSSSGGKPFLSSVSQDSVGKGVVHIANEMLKDRHDSLKGKRCLITGSGKVARSVAKQLLEYGAVPLSFSDQSGLIYEPDGFQEARLKNIDKIKDERGALLGRYIIQSTSAEFKESSSFLDIPCDLIFPCAAMNSIDDDAVGKLADNGCIGVIEGGYSTVTQGARQCLKKRGLLYGPHTLTMTGPAVMNALGPNATDKNFSDEMGRIYKDVNNTAVEFHARGDLFQAANILGFFRVANAMLSHGAV